MENFAAVLRTLLTRIRAFEASRSDRQWPPSASAGGAASPIVGHDPSPYRVAPTAWGIARDEAAEALEPADRSSTPGHPVGRYGHDRGARRRLELTVFGLPVPRGLPST